MLKIGYYAHKWDRRGTPLSLLRTIECLDRSEFAPFILYRKGRKVTGMPEGAIALSPDNIDEVMEGLKLDILHVAKSGAAEWPTLQRWAPLQVETNIFGNVDESGCIDRTIVATAFLAERHGKVDAILPHPIPNPSGLPSILRDTLGVRSNAVLCGRVGRAGNFNPIALEAFSYVRAMLGQDRLFFVIASPDSEAREKGRNMPGMLFTDPLGTDKELDNFLSGLDIFLHYCEGGETFGTAIAEAMMYGLPVVSHYSGVDAGHVEVIGNSGFVARNALEYAVFLNALVLDAKLRKNLGAYASERVSEFNQEIVTAKLERLYREWMS